MWGWAGSFVWAIMQFLLSARWMSVLITGIPITFCKFAFPFSRLKMYLNCNVTGTLILLKQMELQTIHHNSATAWISGSPPGVLSSPRLKRTLSNDENQQGLCTPNGIFLAQKGPCAGCSVRGRCRVPGEPGSKGALGGLGHGTLAGSSLEAAALPWVEPCACARVGIICPFSATWPPVS